MAIDQSVNDNPLSIYQLINIKEKFFYPPTTQFIYFIDLPSSVKYFHI